MTRAEHLAWCKKRALEYCDLGEVKRAWASMAFDLGQHPETQGNIVIRLEMMMVISDQLSTVDKMRKFIEGFN